MSDPTPPASYTFEVSSYPQVFVAAPARRRRYWLHILLLLLTVFTTLVVGARLQYNFAHDLPAFTTDTLALPLFPVRWILQEPARLKLGIPFSLTLLGILLAHECGHFVVAERNGVYATLPYFVPAPTLIGTFGALIRIKSPIRSRKALFDIGIAGPIAGFLVALPVLLWGLALSKPMPPDASNNALEFGYPLIFSLFHHGLAPFTHDRTALSALYLHPVGIAAWVGMFATALNLLPGGQFDGGHIVYAVAPRAHKWVTRTTIGVLIPLGVFFWLGWLVWAMLLLFTGMRHPNVPKWPDIGPQRRWLAVAAALMLALTLVLAPFHGAALFGS
ncbi:MAG TPA: site-2 protease family protein [Candidatus Binatia bacterium]|nr:site-2 protease family protein [Candidatus Binatia bacterium]